MPEILGMLKLKDKLASKRYRVGIRYDFYEAKEQKWEPHPAMPREMQGTYDAVSGWCAKAVDSLADRLIFDGFDNDNFDMMTIFQMNNADILFDSAILGALISACDFIYISPGDDGFPRLQVIDGRNATGTIDPITGMLVEGYAVLDRDENDEPTREAYFLPGETWIYNAGEKAPEVFTCVASYPLLVPIINRPDAKRPFGHSRISRSCMYLQKYAKRVMERSDVSAEFYSFPQKYVTGLSQDAEQLDRWRATISSMIQFDKDEDGDHPILGQFQQQSMTPYIDQLKAAASVFAGETGLTLDDLGFSTDTPSSAEAIKAAHENLRLEARKAQRTFGSGFLNVGYLAACLRDDYPYQRRQVYMTTPRWRPIFEPDASMLSGVGDAIQKIQSAFPEYFDEKKLRDLTGI